MKVLIAVFTILFIVLIVSSLLSEKESDFDMICEIFNESLSSPEFTKLSREERLDAINAKIWANIKTDEAKDILSTVVNAAPDLKYELLKEFIEDSSGKKWDCPAIRDY